MLIISIYMFSISSDTGVHWHNYVLCGIRGIAENLNKNSILGMHVAVLGNVLPNAGLSSSSALVCAAALATAHANQVNTEKNYFVLFDFWGFLDNTI